MPSPACGVSTSPPPTPPRHGWAPLRWLFLAAPLLACPAWEARREGLNIQEEQRKIDKRVADLTLQVQNRPRERVEEQQWEARERIHCAPRDAQQLLHRSGDWASSARVSVSEQDDHVVRLLVVGEGPGGSLVDVMEGLARQAPYFSLEEASARENQWMLVLRSARRCRPPRFSRPRAPPANELPPHLPSAPEILRFRTEENLRIGEALILSVRRFWELTRELGPDVNLHERLDELRATVEAAERDNDRSEDWVRRRLVLVHVLFDVPGPGSGVLRTYRRELVYEGGIPPAEEPWRARLEGAGFRVARREGDIRVLIPD